MHLFFFCFFLSSRVSGATEDGVVIRNLPNELLPNACRETFCMGSNIQDPANKGTLAGFCAFTVSFLASAGGTIAEASVFAHVPHYICSHWITYAWLMFIDKKKVDWTMWFSEQQHTTHTSIKEHCTSSLYAKKSKLYGFPTQIW
uniref:Uncharacterized protein n=1 Tax=Rhipicephalus zambeziensis TaxID=60191 RepID=A0A224Y5P3_9ACAR